MQEALPLATNRVLFLAVLALLVTAILARSLTALATKVGLVDRPGGRKQHEGDIPITGGIAMFAGFAIAALGIGASAPSAGGGIEDIVALVTALGLLVFCGAADDLHDLRPRTKLLLQVVAALLMTSWAGVHVGQLGNLAGFGKVPLLDWSIPFTVICALGLVNAMNMIDGLDGAAGGVALVAALWLGYAALVQGLEMQAVLLLALCSAIAGFLLWNLRMPWRKQAVVFMGDAGSMMLGFALCWFTIDLSQGERRSLSPIACVWILAVPLLDMARVMFVRLIRRVGLFDADREHLHFFLVAWGLSVQASAWVLIGLSVAAGAIGVGCWRAGVPDWAMFYAFMAVLAVILGAAYARELRMRGQHRG